MGKDPARGVGVFLPSVGRKRMLAVLFLLAMKLASKKVTENSTYAQVGEFIVLYAYGDPVACFDPLDKRFGGKGCWLRPEKFPYRSMVQHFKAARELFPVGETVLEPELSIQRRLIVYLLSIFPKDALEKRLQELSAAAIRLSVESPQEEGAQPGPETAQTSQEAI